MLTVQVKQLEKNQNILNRDLEIIKDIIKSLNTEIISTILCGGYGRGEGGWFTDESGEIRPYNDYDIVLVLKDKVPWETVNTLRKIIAQRIRIHWIDIVQMTRQELRRCRLSVFNYDLKYASKVIDGDESIRNDIPDMDAAELGLVEAETLFFTRLWTLLGSLDKYGFKVEREGEESRFFRSQMAKAVLAVTDVLLLMKNAYHPSYVERNKQLQRLYSGKRNFHRLNKWALDEKLAPKAPFMSTEEVEELYSKVHMYFFNEMYKALTKYYSYPVKGVRDIERHFSVFFSTFVAEQVKRGVGGIVFRDRNRLRVAKREFANILLFGNRLFKRDRITPINLAQAYIASAYENGKINRSLLHKGGKWTRVIDKSIPKEMSWDSARLKVAHLRMEVH